MANLKPLIRLHRHELDQKRQALGALYSQLALLAQARAALDADFEKEKQAASENTDVNFTFAQYAEGVRQKRAMLDKAEADLEEQIEEAKESLMETFSELKKYEMTQEERDRLEAEERLFKENAAMDAIGLESFRRKGEE